MIAREPVELAYQHYQAAQERIQDESAQAWEVDLAHLQEIVAAGVYWRWWGRCFVILRLSWLGCPLGG